MRYAVAGMIGMAVAMGIGRFVYTPLLPAMMDSLGLSAADAGLIASANYLGYLVGALLASGSWAEGRERAVMFCALASSAALAGAMGLTTDVGAFLALRFLGGLASAFVMVFLTGIAFGRLAAAGRSDLGAVHFAGVGVGIAASSAMMLALAAIGAAWQAGWFAAAVISVLGLGAVALLVDRGPPDSGAARPEPPLAASGPLARIIVAYGLFGLGYVVTVTFLIAIVRQNAAGGAGFEAIVWLATGLAVIPSVFLWNRIASRIGQATAYAAACLVEAAGVGASVVFDGRAGPLVGGVLLGGTFVAITAIGLRIGRELAPHAPRRALALMTAAFGVGQIVGPIVAGLVAERSGSFLLPSLGAAAALIASAVVARSAVARSNLP